MVSEVDEMPWEAQLTAATAGGVLRDITLNANQNLGRTKSFYEVRNPSGEIICVAGVGVWSFVRKPEIWFLLCKPYLSNLRESILLTRESLAMPKAKYPELIAEVRSANSVYMAFVSRHLRFRPTGLPSLRPNGEAFTQFEVV